MDDRAFFDRYPVLYHLAWSGAVGSIQQHGLLSTSALLELFEVPMVERMKVEGCHRDSPVPITHPKFGMAMIRDNGPMSETKLAGLLDGGLTPTDWYRYLDGRVFLWASKERAQGMLGAYPTLEQSILLVRTEPLIVRWRERIQLTRINSGSTRAMNHRDYGSFRSFLAYPGDELSHVAEVCVPRGVPDIADFIDRVVAPAEL